MVPRDDSKLHKYLWPNAAPKMDAFKNNSEDFYKDILKGKADVSDFERYVYGNSS